MPGTTPTLADLQHLKEAAHDARSAYLLAYGRALVRRLGSLLRILAVSRTARPA